jgi:single-strand DNA-binding protein
MANLNLNKVILGGRITADPELKQTPSGVSVCSFSIAVNRKVGKDKEQQADFFNCKAWRSTAEIVSKYFKKGSSICIVGNLQQNTWTDQNGQKRYGMDVVVDEVMFVDSKNDAPGGNSDGAYIPPSYTANDANFEEVKEDSDLPF